MDLSYEQKQQHYRAGAYAFPVPPVSTGQWNEAAWIHWIDTHGQWLPLTCPGCGN